MITFIGPVAFVIAFEVHQVQPLVITTWLHYWQVDDRLFVLLRLSTPICTGGLMFDEDAIADWIIA